MAYTAGQGSGGVNPFEAFSSGVLSPQVSPNAQILTDVPPSLNLSSRADEPFLNAKGGTQPSLTEALFQLPKDKLQALQQKMISTGLFPNLRVTGFPDNATLAAYNTVLSYSFLAQTANPDKAGQATPDAILDTLINTKPKDTTQSTTTVNLTNPVQARQSLLTAFSDKLGRRPTDAEVSAFTSALNDYETKNPSTQTADVAGDGSGTVRSVTNTDKGTGSLNFANDFATNYATGDPAHQAEYQAAQHLDFYNLALQTLAGGGINTGNTD